MSSSAARYSALLSIAMATLVTLVNPTHSYSETSESQDNTGKDLAGISLIAANVAAASYLGHSVNSGRTNQTLGYLGLAFGGGTVLLGATENTSFSYGVTAAGSVTMALAIMSMVQSSPDEDNEPDESFDLSRSGLVVAPTILSDPGEQARFGLVFSSSFESFKEIF